MPKIAMIGAGSVGFAQKLIADILSFEALQDTHFALMDIDAERLDVTYQVTLKLFEQEKLPATVIKTMNRQEALEGADYAICMILANGIKPFENEVNIPYKYGITQCVGDTLCVGGVLRALRTIPIMVDICQDMEKVCPDAWMLNYTNPMPMVTWACNVATNIKFMGLCHGVQATAGEMAEFIDLPLEQARYWTAGINHLAWFLRFESAEGKDLYPRVWEKLEREGPPEGDKIRWDFAQHIGYFMTESSGHFSEYIPYYRKRDDIMEQLGGPGFAGEHGYTLRGYYTHWKPHAERTFRQIHGEEAIPFGERSAEYASNIINSIETNELFRFNGNVMNHGLIRNLPEGSCVEVPCFVDSLGIHPCAVEDLPPQCAALDLTNINVHTLAVQAALTGDKQKAFQAVLLDPLTSAVLPPSEIRQMFDELFAANREWMPQF